MDIDLILRELNSGKTLSEISVEHGKAANYYSCVINRTKPQRLEEIKHIHAKNLKSKKIPRGAEFQLDIKKIEEYIDLRMSCPQIANQMNTHSICVKNAVKLRASRLVDKLEENGRIRQHNSMKGKTNKLWKARAGKTYEEIYGSKEKADEMRKKRSDWLRGNNIAPIGTTYEEKFGKEMADYLKKKRSDWMKLNNITPPGDTYEERYGKEMADYLKKKRSDWMKLNWKHVREFVSRTSKPQLILYDIVKNVFNSAQLEYMVQVDDEKYIWLDIAIPDRKINIEYDGLFWHTQAKDDVRDRYLKELGWNVYRIKSLKNLTREQLQIEFDKLHLV